MRKRLLCIVGETSGGKDTVAKYLKETYGLNPVCSHTNRPPRKGETNGIEHWFDTQEEFERIFEAKTIVAYTKIEDSKSGVKGYEYFATTEDLEKADLYIIDPNGVKYLKRKMPELELLVVYVTACKEIRLQRAIDRDESQKQAFLGRCKNEAEQFKEFDMSASYDYRIDNNGSKEDLLNMVDYIMSKEGYKKKNLYYASGMSLVEGKWQSCGWTIEANSFLEAAQIATADETFRIHSLSDNVVY